MPRPSNRVFAAAACAAAAVLAAACGNNDDATGPDDPPSPAVQPPTTYTLRTVNGQPLPAVVAHDSATTTALVSDVYTLNADSTYTEQVALQVTAANGATLTQNTTYAGTWSLSGFALTVTNQTSNVQYTGTITGGNTLTTSVLLSNQLGSTAVYTM